MLKTMHQANCSKQLMAIAKVCIVLLGTRVWIDFENAKKVNFIRMKNLYRNVF